MQKPMAFWQKSSVIEASRLGVNVKFLDPGRTNLHQVNNVAAETGSIISDTYWYKRSKFRRRLIFAFADFDAKY